MATTELTLPRMAGASNIMIGWLCPGDVTNAFASSLASTLIGDTQRRITGRVSLQSSPRIAQTRTEMVDMFLSTKCEWLLMVDADMSWSYEAFEKLCRAADKDKRPIMGGLCFGGGRDTEKLHIFPTLYNIQEIDGELDSRVMEEYPRDRVIEVSATGAAFLMVHRSVFIRMQNLYGQNNPFPWFMETVVRGKPLGEDITFCVRATSAGFKVHVHTGVKIGHEKRYLLTEELFDKNREVPE